jgi:hypothetical protein
VVGVHTCRPGSHGGQGRATNSLKRKKNIHAGSRSFVLVLHCNGFKPGADKGRLP